MRIEGWPEALEAYLEASRAAPFVWGQNDCALWASTFVDQITGSDWAGAWRGLYDTEEGALALMAERGFADCEAIADAALPSKPVKLAKRGDVVMHSSGGLGLCYGRLSYFMTIDRGLVPVLTKTCTKAWEV